MTQKMALKLHDTDNVAVCTSEVSAGDIVAVVAPRVCHLENAMSLE